MSIDSVDVKWDILKEFLVVAKLNVRIQCHLEQEANNVYCELFLVKLTVNLPELMVYLKLAKL